MSVRHLLTATADSTAASVLSTGRVGSGVAVLLGLAGLVIGVLALARRGGGRLRAALALTSGLVATALGGLLVATSDGGVGTGNGLAGAYLALAVGLVAAALGGLALARSRHAPA